MKASEVREKYLNFFKANNHVVIASAPIIPENDPTTLFTSSGMQPLVPYLLGEEHPAGTKLVDSQKCFRADDIEEVGDNRHTTFFEMLGNWSLGEYFKKEQLSWFFSFLVDELGLDKMDRTLLTALCLDHQGGPVGLDTLATAISEDTGTVEEVIEPFLIKKGLLKRTRKGRVATPKAFNHLKIPLPKEYQMKLL